MRIKYFIFLVLVSFLSCKNYKNDFNKGKGSFDNAVKNAIIDFSHTYKDKRVSKIFFYDPCPDFKKAQNQYCIYIRPGFNKYYLDTTAYIGNYTEYFPTRFKEYKKELYLYYDSQKPITKEIIDILNKYDAIDSSRLKFEIGETKQIPKIKITSDSSIKSYYYIFCKNNLENFKKIESAYQPEIYPNLNCN